MALLRLISWPYFRKHLLRTALTSAGIVLGVSVLVGMHTANQTVLEAFSRTVDRIAGKTELQVTSGEFGFNEDILEKVQAATSVRIAVPAIEAIVDPHIPGQGSLLVLAVDMTGDRGLRDYDVEEDDGTEIDDPLIFLAQPDSLMLSADFAKRNGITSGSRVTLGTAEGDKTFVVRGIMTTSGLASAFGGNLAVMDIYAAQRMFGRGRTFDRIDLAVKPGVTLAECQRELSASLGHAFQIQPPSGRGQQFEAMLAGYSLMMNLASGFVLFIGMFIIYNSFVIAVSQRRSEIGILRALGATQGQIRTLFLGESAILGLLGSAVGVVVGMMAARLLAVWIGGLIANVFSVAQRVDDLSMNPATLGVALAIGVATSLAGGALPARQAARLDPVRALQRGAAQIFSTQEHTARAAMGVLCVLLAIVCVAIPGSRPTFYVGYAAAVGAALLFSPQLTVWLSKLLRPVLKSIRSVEGALAADSLLQAPRRTAGSVVALMLSIALVVAFSGMANASYGSILAWMNTTLDPDLLVLPSPNLDVQTTRFPETMEPELTAMPGVSRVQTLRNTRVQFRGTPIMVVAVDVKNVSETAHLPPVAGDEDEMYRRAAAGNGVMVSDNLAQLQGLSLGETIELHAPYGMLQLPIVGVVIDYSDQQGAVIMDRALFKRFWKDDSVNAYRVYVDRSSNVLSVRQHILDTYAGRRQVFALTNAELKAYVSRIAGQFLSLSSAQVAVSVLIAILGIVNTLTVSIADRRRELGVLRAVGALRAQIRRTIWIEAASVAAVGLVLGLALGAVNLYYLLNMVERDIMGMRLDYAFPAALALGLVPTLLGAAVLAAVWPAESAVRGSLMEALGYE
jgi:putative ABC transport system permease protein